MGKDEKFEFSAVEICKSKKFSYESCPKVEVVIRKPEDVTSYYGIGGSIKKKSLPKKSEKLQKKKKVTTFHNLKKFESKRKQKRPNRGKEKNDSPSTEILGELEFETI